MARGPFRFRLSFEPIDDTANPPWRDEPRPDPDPEPNGPDRRPDPEQSPNPGPDPEGPDN